MFVESQGILSHWLNIPIYCDVKARINNKPVELKKFHCTMTQVGWDHAGDRAFNTSSVLSPVSWLQHDISTGSVIGTSTYTRPIWFYDQHYRRHVATSAGTWSGGAAKIANNLSINYSQAIASWTPVSYANGDYLDLYWRWYYGTGDANSPNFTYEGLYRIMSLILNPNNLYDVFNVISLRKASDNTQWMAQTATYSQVSSQGHQLEATFTPGASPPAIRKMRIYGEGSGGLYYCYEYDFGVDKIPQQGINVIVTVDFHVTMG